MIFWVFLTALQFGIGLGLTEPDSDSLSCWLSLRTHRSVCSLTFTVLVQVSVPFTGRERSTFSERLTERTPSPPAYSVHSVNDSLNVLRSLPVKGTDWDGLSHPFFHIAGCLCLRTKPRITRSVSECCQRTWCVHRDTFTYWISDSYRRDSCSSC